MLGSHSGQVRLAICFEELKGESLISPSQKVSSRAIGSGFNPVCVLWLLHCLIYTICTNSHYCIHNNWLLFPMQSVSVVILAIENSVSRPVSRRLSKVLGPDRSDIQSRKSGKVLVDARLCQIHLNVLKIVITRKITTLSVHICLMQTEAGSQRVCAHVRTLFDRRIIYAFSNLCIISYLV